MKFTRLLLSLVCVAAMFGMGCGVQVDEPLPPPAKTQAPAAPASVSAAVKDAAGAIEATAVYFAFDRYDLNDQAQAALKAKAELLKRYPGISVKIEGHCDSRGTESYNLALGERRAKAAYDYLVMQGVNPSQLAMVSYGHLYPAVSGTGEAVWSKNRRAEFRPSIK